MKSRKDNSTGVARKKASTKAAPDYATRTATAPEPIGCRTPLATSPQASEL